MTITANRPRSSTWLRRYVL